MWMASWASSSDRTLVSAGLIEGVYIDISIDPSKAVCQLTGERQVDMGRGGLFECAVCKLRSIIYRASGPTYLSGFVPVGTGKLAF